MYIHTEFNSKTCEGQEDISETGGLRNSLSPESQKFNIKVQTLSFSSQIDPWLSFCVLMFLGQPCYNAKCVLRLF